MAALKQNQEADTVSAKLREREKGKASEQAAVLPAKLPGKVEISVILVTLW